MVTKIGIDVFTLLFLTFLHVNGQEIKEADNHYESTASIAIEIPNEGTTGTLVLIVWEDYFDQSIERLTPYQALRATVDSRGKFSFQIRNLNKPAYFSLYFNKDGYVTANDTPLLNHYLIEPSDSINIKINRRSKVHVGDFEGKQFEQTRWQIDNILFSGTGSFKLKCKHSIDLASRGYDLKFINPTKNSISRYDSITKVKLEILKSFKSKISQCSYEILEADVIGISLHAKLLAYGKIDDVLTSKSANFTAISKEYISLLFALNYSSFRRLGKSINDLHLAFDSYPPEIKEKLLVIYFVKCYSYLKSGDSLLKNAISNAKSTTARYVLESLFNSLSNGTVAYDFSLPDTNDKNVRLSDFKGKVVVLDFWFTGCGACRIFYQKHFSPVKKLFKHDTSVVFVAISVDRDREKWLKSISSGLYTSSDVINLYTDGKGSNHPMIKNYKIHGYPRPMIIDRYGRIYKASGLDLRNADSLKVLIEQCKKGVRK